MNEKIYKTMSGTGAGSLVIGILTIVFGVTIGTICIVNGARLLHGKSKLTF